MNEKSEFTESIEINGTIYTDYWVKIRKKTGITGWVFKALLVEIEHLYLIERDSLFGYVNYNGEIKIEPQYNGANFAKPWSEPRS